MRKLIEKIEKSNDIEEKLRLCICLRKVLNFHISNYKKVLKK